MRRLTACLLPLLLAACSAGTGPSTAETVERDAESARLTAWLDAEFEKDLDFSPQWRTRLGDRVERWIAEVAGA